MAYFGYVEKEHTQNSLLSGKGTVLWDSYSQDFFFTIKEAVFAQE